MEWKVSNAGSHRLFSNDKDFPYQLPLRAIIDKIFPDPLA